MERMVDSSDRSEILPGTTRRTSRRAELVVFAVIAAFVSPVIAVGVVG